jgi:hypothetical protein
MDNEPKATKPIGKPRRSFLEGLPQSAYPIEFRIRPAPTTPDVSGIPESPPDPLSTAPAPRTIPLLEWTGFLAEMGTNLWRMRRKMLQPGTDQPLDSVRSAYRFLEYALDAMKDVGIEIQDHDGALFDLGLSLNPISFVHEPGLSRDRVIETIKPTVYLNGESIQMGQVVVGTPEKPQGPRPTGSHGDAD